MTKQDSCSVICVIISLLFLLILISVACTKITKYLLKLQLCLSTAQPSPKSSDSVAQPAAQTAYFLLF